MIAIDLVGTTINSGTKTYNKNFLKQLNYKSFEEKILVFVSKSYLIDEKKNLNSNIKYIVKSGILNNSFVRLFWMQFILPFELKYYGVKIFFSPMNYAPLFLRFTKIKSVLAIHTVLPWLYFNFLPGNYLKNLLIKKIMELSIFFADKIIVPSYYAKQKIIEKLKIEQNKISIIYLGSDHILEESNNYPAIKNFNYNKKYFLSVLSCVKYHNILNLLKAFKKFKEETKTDIKFVIILSILDKNYFRTINSFVEKNFQNKEVEILLNLDNKYLRNLYKNSSFYLFSSYSEVFGFTSLEAMNYNIPILISDTSALKEINSNLVTYFDPDDLLDISNKIKETIEKLNDNLSLKKNYQLHLKKYLWRNNFLETIKILKNEVKN